MIKPGKIYIIPTRFGLIFLFSIVTILMAGAIYSNNLVNMLAFFLLAIALVSMVQTHNNLKNIALKMVATEPGFAGDVVTMTAALENLSQEPRFFLETRSPKSFSFLSEVDEGFPLLPKGVLRRKTTYTIPKRGKHSIEQVRVATVYPVGLFYAWMWLKTDAEFLVYPARKGSTHLPSSVLSGAEGNSQLAVRGGEDFRGHRSYVPGDSGNRIDWKAFARGRSLLVKEFDEGNPDAILLDWDLVSAPDVEARLSQLTVWVEAAHRQRRRFALRLPNEFIPPGEGLQHYERCLTSLALYPGGRDAAS